MSRDGRWIAYVNDEDTLSTLVLQNRETRVERQLSPASEFFIENLTFSPDGASVYYTHRSAHEYQNDLYRQSLDGGPPVFIMSNVDSKVTFAPEGQSFAFLRAKPANSGYQLITANFNGSNENLIYDPYRNIFAPAWSPDGKRIAFFSFDDEADEIGNRFRLREMDLATHTHKPISQKFWGYLGEICWLNGSKELLVIAGDTPAPVSQIWHIDALTEKATKVTNDLNDYNGLEVDPGTGEILTSYSESYSGIWITGKHRNFGEAQQITYGAGQEDGTIGVAWGKNGRIVFSGRKTGYWTLWVMNPDGSDRAQLTPEAAQDGSPVLSPDSRTIFFASDRGDGLASLWKVNSDATGLEKLPNGKADLSPGQQESLPDITPDGKYLLYRHTDAERNRQLRKWPVSGGEALALSNLQIISNPAVSPDGTLVAFLFADLESDPIKTAIMFLPIAGGDPVKIVPVKAATPWHTPIKWQPDGSALTYVACDRSACNLWNLPFTGGPAYQITKFDKDEISAFTWSPDGDRLAISRSFTRNNLVLISGFRTE
jgi:Tol biopolymer transport system component